MKDKISKLHDYVLAKRFRIYLFLVIIISSIYRISGYKTYISQDGTIRFAGIDSVYHFRAVMYTIHNWPNTIGFDPGTGYPVGETRGQFGTIFDQFMALMSFVVSGGDMPSTVTVKLVMLFTPPILFIIVIISVYLISSKIMDKYAGIISATFISFISTPIFSISSLGRPDHHIAELLAMSFIVLSFIYAFSLIEKLDKIRDLHNFKFIIGYSMLCTLAILFYLSIWPPGVFIVGLTALFYYIYSIVQTEKLKKELILLFGVSQLSILLLVSLLLFDFSLKTNFSSVSNIGLSNINIIHLLIIVVSMSVMILLTILYMVLERFDLEKYYAPISLSVLSVSTVIFYFQMNNIFNYIIAKALEYVGLGMTEHAKIWVNEEVPAIESGFFAILSSYYGVFFLLFLIFLIYPLYKILKRDNISINYLYVHFLSVFFLLMFLTQSKFSYYLTLLVSINSVYILLLILKGLSWDYMGRMDMWKHVFLIILAMSVSLGFVFSPTLYNEGIGQSTEWMNDNTPEPGIEVNNYTELASYEQYNFTYPEESYGVMTTPDYGHWVTSEAERIPFTNPFHRHLIEYTRYIMAQSEKDAQNSLKDANYESNKEYIIMDWGSVMNIGRLHQERVEDSISYDVYEEVGDKVYLRNQNHYNSLQLKLYLYHGSNFSSQLGGFGIYPYSPVESLDNYRYIYGSNESVTPRHTRLREKIIRENTNHTNIKSEDFIPMSSSYAKVFERVPGADIEGSGVPPESQIIIETELMEPNNNETFYYKQVTRADKKGHFNLTVPYSTVGYNKWGPEYGYSNPQVHAVSDYNIYSNGNLMGEVDVPESKIIGINNSSIKLNYGEK